MTTVLKGRNLTPGRAEGEAIVSQQRFCFIRWQVDALTGEPTHPDCALVGKKLTGKVLVFSTGWANTGGGAMLLDSIKHGTAPIAFVNREAETQYVACSILGELLYGKKFPIVDRLDTDPLKAIKTGDHVVVDGNTGLVEITPRDQRPPKFRIENAP